MNVVATKLNDVLIIEPAVYEDARGFFMETYHQRRYQQADISTTFVQDNLSRSVRNTLRGLHFQRNRPQAKLVQVLSGEVYDVAVDIRPGSATFGQWVGVELSAENRRQLFVPEGFAHGFCVLSEWALFAYKCSALYDPDDEGGLLWSDPGIGIDWPVTDPIITEKDAAFACLSDLGRAQLPQLG
jgi:dTDP-4-dehydrorhamnose 3,5-epimerase